MGSLLSKSPNAVPNLSWQLAPGDRLAVLLMCAAQRGCTFRARITRV